MISNLVDWTPEQFAGVEEEIMTAKHNLHETGIFDDAGLLKMFDTHPERDLTICTMGDSNSTFQWRDGDRNGASSKVLLDLLHKGRLWINLRNLLTHHADVRKAVDAMYDEIEYNKPGFKAEPRSANLLISSPGALVHYHIDVPVNMLWHIRGEKRVWVYPPFNTKFSPQHIVEKICASEMVEDAPFDPSFDAHAQVFDVKPGQLLTWPQLTPHRVENTGEGLQISLSTEHKNARATRRINVHLANQWLRRTCGLPCRSFEVDGPTAHVKQAIIRVVRKWGECFGKEIEKKNVYKKTFKVDPDSPTGVTIFEEAGQPVTPEEQAATAA